MNLIIAMVRASGFLVLTVLLMPFQWVLVRLGWRAANHLPHFYHRILCKILGITVVIEGDATKAGLIVANHVSWLDIPVLSTARPVSFIAKMEVFHWPLFGTLARLQKTLFVDRNTRMTTAEKNEALLHRLKRGETLVLFPEGTSSNGREVKPFKSSYFAAVERSNLPLIPVSLIYQSQQGLPLTLRQSPNLAWFGDTDLLPHLWGFLKGGPIVAKLIFHEPLHPQVFTNRKALARAAENQIRQSLHGARKIG